MNIGLIGSSGMLGAHIREYFIARGSNVIALDRKNNEIDQSIKLDLVNPSSYIRSLKRLKSIDCVIFCSAQMLPTSSRERLYLVNAESLKFIASYCKSRNIMVMYVSSGCVYKSPRSRVLLAPLEM